MIRTLLQFAITVPADQVNVPKVDAGDATFNAIVGLVYVIIAALALFYIVRGGLLFITSGSDPKSVKDARETVLYAAIGLVVSTLVFGIIQFVAGSIQ